MMKNRYIRYALFLVLACVAFGYLIWNYRVIIRWADKVLYVLRPLLIGGAIAFILNRPVKFFEKCLSRWLKGAKYTKAVRALSMIAVYLLFAAVSFGVVYFIVPQLYQSVTTFTGNLEAYYNNLENFLAETFSFHPDQWLENMELEKKLLDAVGLVPTAVGAMFGMTANIVGTLLDILLGVFISVYLLLDKDKLCAQAKKCCLALLSPIRCEKLFQSMAKAAKTFSDFISGQLLEACILGVLCFAGMKLLRFEYAMLISIIIALTNLVPIIGPIVGAVPCAFILLLVNPIKAVWFVVYIIVLQQLESNLIYPKVVGTSVGLPAFWVLVSVIAGGGLFGILGMLLAIPTASLFYGYLRQKVYQRNASKACAHIKNSKPIK